jgi:hypothetical protein
MLIGLGAGEVARLWDVPSRQRLGSLQVLPLVNDKGEAVAGGSAQGVRTEMVAGPGGTVWVAAASAHPTRWTLSKEAWSRLVCGWAGRSLTPAEWRQYVATTPPADLACER